MTPEQMRALYQQRQQHQVHPAQRPSRMPPSPLPKSGPVHRVQPQPSVQNRTSGGCCGRRWQG
ncbi:hypothetical protein HPY28_09805 [Brevibacillus sp. HB1.2]|uniref:hypothetical protein n=1 Tax=Brevibacillus TaxID=55080 RepID=UPI000A8E9ECC|nr:MULTISPECIES: hypothetical protein [Brevibacillus]MDC0763397.1 hypothetical protein [Brevibacillus sp. AG]MED2744746.1 hypothetical protein [Brevibacillus porteri]MED2817844.1 hypothetical protein [Brevibacillus porteri]MED4899517.1 hypothetical protein [Brevibacillus porteri]NTU20608.1 hypothetical protein [Brevibacillus sp. HB1.2]